MYNIEYFELSQFPRLKEAWASLASGSEMTIFQSYEWYEMLVNLNANVRNKHFETLLVAARKDNVVVMIAPLWIVKSDFGKYNKRGVYFFGRAQWSDYLNFIYSDFDHDALDAILHNVTNKFGVSNFSFEDVPTKSSFFRYLNEKYTHLSDDGNVCVQLRIPDSIEAYHKMLSKSARQNIRTAFNRAEKDGVSLTFDFDDKNVDICKFAKYRQLHLGDKIKTGGKTIKDKIVYFLSTKILGRGVYTFVPYTPFETYKDAHFITCKDQNNALCAAYCYVIDKLHNQIVLTAVATNPDFYKYSPGILCIYKFVLAQMHPGGYASVDFTRGNEKYKYVLGGEPHYNQHLIFNL